MTWHRMRTFYSFCASAFFMLLLSCTAAQIQSGMPQSISEAPKSDWPAAAVAELVDNCKKSALTIDSNADSAAVAKACRCFVEEASTSFDLEHFEVFEEEIVASFAREGRFQSCR